MRAELVAFTCAAVLFASLPAGAEPPRAPLFFVADPKFGVETTVRTGDSLTRVVYRSEELFPELGLDERHFLAKSIAVFVRGLELVFVQEPIAELSVLFSLEVGGHGARARELDLKPTFLFHLPGVYRFLFAPDDPPGTRGFTNYLSPEVVEGDRALLGTLGGLEANSVHTWWINSRIVRANGRVHRGDLLVYGASKLPYWDSFLSGSATADTSDVRSYVTALADRFNQWRPEDRRRIERRLSAAYLWHVFDPTLLYAVYGTFVAGLWQGRRTSEMPLPTVFGMTALLSPRFVLSPFGAEHMLDLFLARDGRMLDLYGRVGSSGLADHYGAGARVLGVRAGERVTLGAELDVWRQPEILLGERGVYERAQRVGVNAGVLLDVRLTGILGITGKLAAKTPGFVVGQPIGGGVHGYAGVSLAW